MRRGRRQGGIGEGEGRVDVERHRDEAIEVILPGIVGVVQSELEGDPLMDEVPDTLPLDTSEGRQSQAAALGHGHQ